MAFRKAMFNNHDTGAHVFVPVQHRPSLQKPKVQPTPISFVVLGCPTDGVVRVDLGMAEGPDLVSVSCLFYTASCTLPVATLEESRGAGYACQWPGYDRQHHVKIEKGLPYDVHACIITFFCLSPLPLMTITSMRESTLLIAECNSESVWKFV